MKFEISAQGVYSIKYRTLFTTKGKGHDRLGMSQIQIFKLCLLVMFISFSAEKWFQTICYEMKQAFICTINSLGMKGFRRKNIPLIECLESVIDLIVRLRQAGGVCKFHIFAQNT